MDLFYSYNNKMIYFVSRANVREGTKGLFSFFIVHFSFFILQNVDGKYFFLFWILFQELQNFDNFFLELKIFVLEKNGQHEKFRDRRVDRQSISLMDLFLQL